MRSGAPRAGRCSAAETVLLRTTLPTVQSSRGTPYTLARVAETGARFTDFAPYVAAINDDGLVAFQAATPSGTGVYTADGTRIAAVAESDSGTLCSVCSHADLNQRGECCFYATQPSGVSAGFLLRGAMLEQFADSCGPLGPTMNEEGSVAFRAPGTSAAGIYTHDRGRTVAVAESGSSYSAFHGLPVINSAGLVAFRADLRAGGAGIYVGDGTCTHTVAETGAVFGTLGGFPSMNDAGAIAFGATLRKGGSGVFVSSGGRIATMVDESAGFESFRGALINNAGHVVFYATPRNGVLGVYAGPDPARDCVLAVGASMGGSTVTEFALNPVSFNNKGQLAIRVRLADQRQAILRADPASTLP